MDTLQKLRIAVLRGGPSSEYDVSLKSGAAVINALAEHHRVVDILIDKEGEWHKNGLNTNAAQGLKGVDVVIIALHGEYGEDGTVQRILDKLGVPYIGSGSYSSALAMHKPRARYAVKGLPMVKLPQHYLVKKTDGTDYTAIANKIFSKFGPPYIVKPASGGSSVGLTVAHTIAVLPSALTYVAGVTSKAGGDESLLVEQFIQGRETTCSVVDKYRGEDCYALPPVEIVLPSVDGKRKDVFDYEAKYSTDEALCAQEHCPANFNKEEKTQIEGAARAVHQALELSHYSRSDFILAPSGLYYLETNTLPGLTEQSLLPRALEAVGSNLREFLEHSIKLALEKK